MKNVRIRFCALAVVALLAGVGSSVDIAYGQSVAMRAKIPFDFYAGEKKLPAGDYTVASASVTDPSVLRINDGKGNVMLTFSIGVSNRSAAEGQLLFHRYGEQYFLSEVRWVGYPARQLEKSAMEIRIAKNLGAERVAATAKNRN